MKPKKQAAYRIFTEHLEALINSGSYQPGEKLPSLEQFIQETNLSSYAVQKGMKHLQEKGLIELRHGSGTYVSTARANGNSKHGWNITIFCEPNSEKLGSSYLSHALLGIQELAMKHDCNLTLRRRDYFQYYAAEPPLPSVITDADGILFLGEYDYFKLEIPSALPAVGIDMADCAGGVVSAVTLDPIEAARLATQFFIRHGRKKIKGFAYSDIPFIQLEVDAFQKHFAPHGEFELHSSPIGNKKVNFPTSDDTGVLFFAGHQCEYYLQTYFERFGVEMTDRFDVLSIDGKSLTIPSFRPVSTVWIDWKEAGETAFTELLRRLAHPGSAARRISIIPKIKEVKRT